MKRIFLDERLLRGDTGVNNLQPLDRVSWIWSAAAAEPPPPEGVFLRFRLKFDSSSADSPIRIDVTADERFALLIDGEEIGRGPHRCTVNHWLYQSYELPLSPGPHELVAVVWRLGHAAPSQQLSWRGGFALAAEDRALASRLDTGTAPWLVAALSGTAPGGLDEESVRHMVGSPFAVRGTSFIDEAPPDSSYAPAVVVRGPVWSNGDKPNFWGGRVHGWQLYPDTIPDMLMRPAAPGVFRAGPHSGRAPGPFVVPARSRVEITWDLGDYFCAFPDMECSGGAGALVRWGWAEALRGPDGLKFLDRDAPDGGDFSGFWDYFRPDGRRGARFTTPWWRSGRFCRIEIETAEDPLSVSRIGIVETRYPVDPESSFTCDDTTLGPVQTICERGLQMCMHETFFDCPHYEQQMYVGDTRVQMLAAAAMTADDRLVRRAADLFDESRRPDGITAMQFPARKGQESATYALVFPLMLRDAMMLHDCRDWLRVRAPGMRGVLHGLATYQRQDGLLENLPGWSFIDWAPAWNDRKGVPPGGRIGEGASAPASFFHVLALQAAAEIDGALGERRLAAHWRAESRRVAAAAVAAFWDERRGLLADDEAHTSYSEHAQCLALLAGALPPPLRRRALSGLLEAPDLARCTVYFSHYLFATLLRFGCTDVFLERLDLWREYCRRHLRTPQEAPDGGKNGQKETRSDCHAWGSHPLWHLHAGVAGVRPASPFYGSVVVAPQPGRLSFIRSETPTPRGPVCLDLHFDNGRASGAVTLPPGLEGTFKWRGCAVPLTSGENSLQLPDSRFKSKLRSARN